MDSFMALYRITNLVSGTVYYGISNNPQQRWRSHCHFAKNGRKTPLYDAMRSYGKDSFEMTVLCYSSEAFIRAMEVNLIANGEKKYNLHSGGMGGFCVPQESIGEWKVKLSASRQGRQPALGMSHSDQTKEVCRVSGLARWDGKRASDRWNLDEVLSLGFAEANRRYGIPKTTYYRALRKAALSAA
jgi:group I intron endonuclease